MYSDHEFVSDTESGTDIGKCAEQVLVYNQDFDHNYVETWLEVYDRDVDGNVLWGKVDPNAVCQDCNKGEDDIVHQRRTLAPCNKPSYSVVHPPDQFRHWCSILEAGGDCMHMEDI